MQIRNKAWSSVWQSDREPRGRSCQSESGGDIKGCMWQNCRTFPSRKSFIGIPWRWQSFSIFTFTFPIFILHFPFSLSHSFYFHFHFSAQKAFWGMDWEAASAIGPPRAEPARRTPPKLTRQLCIPAPYSLFSASLQYVYFKFEKWCFCSWFSIPFWWWTYNGKDDNKRFGSHLNWEGRLIWQLVIRIIAKESCCNNALALSHLSKIATQL